MKKLLFVVTVPHTGTRSLMNIIDRNGYVELSRLLQEKKEERKLWNTNKIYSYVSGNRHHIYLAEYSKMFNRLTENGIYGGINNDPAILDNKINIIHGHISKETADAVQFLSNHIKIITTCRDPLLTLISVYQRETYKTMGMSSEINIPLRAHKELDAWCLWAKYIYKTDPFIVPIDIKKDNLIYNDFDFSLIYDINVTNPKNKEGYPLKDAYENKDLKYIKKELGKSYNLLLKMKPLLKPVLEEIGYEGLMWWK